MATIAIVAMIEDKVTLSEQRRMSSSGDATDATTNRGERVVRELERILERTGWIVEREAEWRDPARPDLTMRRGALRYVVEAKSAPEGRADRLVPLWAQACLQVLQHRDEGQPLAVVSAPRISSSAAEQVLEFAARYAPEVAAGVIDMQGLRRFHGPGLEGLEADPMPGAAHRLTGSGTPVELFTDANQWLLKVLLAEEIPEEYLSAPRARYRTAPHLARAAEVSVPSAYRFVQQLKEEGYLDESARHLRVVRRHSLFSRWQAAAARRVREVPVRLLVGGNPQAAATRLARESGACLGLFAAAEALGVGFVHGVVPYLYVRQEGEEAAGRLGNLVPAERHEPPHLILRRPRAPKSVFRGAVQREGVFVSDLLQVWLDVSQHPSRGQEQADLIRRRLLEPFLSGEAA